jgi:signal peptidase I
LATLILVSGLLFTGIVACNLGDNGPVILGSKNKVDNSGFLSKVFVITTDNSEQKFAIHPWYGVVSPSNVTQITVPENTPAKISVVPYILPVFWITMLAEINPYLPVAAEILGYTSVITLLLLPLWYKKTTFGKRRKRIRFHRSLAHWKRTLQLG